MSQQDLIDYMSDPENIKKAAEGSMEKRRRVMYPTFSDKLDEILAAHQLATIRATLDNSGDTGQDLLLASKGVKKLLLDLIEREVIGEDEFMVRDGLIGTSHYQLNRNNLRAEQRKKIKGE